MHQADKYHRIQDIYGRIGVIIPEGEFILHATQMRDMTNKMKSMEEDLKRLNAKHHEYLDYKRNVQETITKEVQKARTQQRQEDAKVYAHWRDKAKSLEDQLKSSMNLEKNYKLLSESYGNLLSKYADKCRKLLEIKRVFNHDSE